MDFKKNQKSMRPTAGGNWYLKIPFDFEEQLETGLWKMSQPAKLAKLGTRTGSLEKI